MSVVPSAMLLVSEEVDGVHLILEKQKHGSGPGTVLKQTFAFTFQLNVRPFSTV